MNISINKQVHLVSRPTNGVALENFALVEAPISQPADGQVLLRTIFLSLDPYMRGRMYAGANYASSTALNAPMIGETVSRVVTSRHADFSEGDFVISAHGWQEFALSDGADLEKIDPDIAPISTALGVLGMPGMTGYAGLLRHGQPKAGETVVVSAASGAVGSMVGQVAKIKNARAVGIAGGPDKCRYLIEELGFDAAVDHRAPDLAGQLAAACPDGIDIYYDNVGGQITATIIDQLNTYARILVCGTIAVDRNQPQNLDLPDMQTLLSHALVKQLTIRGFMVWSMSDMKDAFRADVSSWIKEGKIVYKQHIVDGLENAPEAFLGLFTGTNFGKLLIRVSAE